jgi:hypothetical protein
MSESKNKASLLAKIEQRVSASKHPSCAEFVVPRVQSPSRRSFMRGALGTIALRAALATGLLAVERPVHAQVAEAIGIASGAMNLVLSFAKRGNALGAMLGAIRELQVLTIQQLGLIGVQLGSIIATIDALPDKVKQELRKQYQYELTSELIGASNRYQTYLRAAQASPDIFTRPEVKQQIQSILVTVQSHRSTLAVTDEGYGPEACIVVPIACALEVAALLRLDFHKEVIVAVLHDYRNWLREILSDRPGAIADAQRIAMQTHDAALTAAEALPRWTSAKSDKSWKKTWGDYIDLNSFKLGQAPPIYGASGDDSCYLFSKAPVSFLVPQGVVGAGRGAALRAAARGFPSTSLTIRASVSQIPNEYGVQLLQYQPGLRTFGSLKKVGNELAEEGFLPAAGDPCYMESRPTLPGGRDEMIQAVEASESWKVEQMSAERVGFIGKLLNANEQRMRIGLCVRATTVALESDNRICEQLELLTGRPT